MRRGEERCRLSLPGASGERIIEPMRSFVVVAVMALGVGLPAKAEKARKVKAPLPAKQYPMHDEHAKEKVTIAAEPGDTKETEPDTRLDYFHHGFMPVRIIVTNDGDVAISLEDARIHFVAGDNTVIPAATDEELERRLFSKKSSQTTIPMPMPIPSITIHHPPVDQKIVADEHDFGFATTTVPPHETVAGYLYYDTRNIDDPVLSHAEIEVRSVHPVGSTKEFYAFEIPLHPTAEAVKPAGKAEAGKAEAGKSSQ